MKYTDYVNTKQGSKSTHRFSNGNTLPLVQLPFGMAAFCPQTSDGDLRWYYHPDDRSFEGIRLTHQPSPWIADYGAVCFLPQTAPVHQTGEDRWTGFRPEDAVLTPYYMKYDLLRPRCVTELTPTVRGAKIRLTFRNGSGNYFSVLPVAGRCSYEYSKVEHILYVTTDDCSGGEHVNFKEYIAIKFPEDAVNVDGILTQRSVEDGVKALSGEGKEVAMHIPLNTQEVEIALATSYISFEYALRSLENEIGDKSFDELKELARQEWENRLSLVEIESDDEDQLKTFYSCMYRAFLYPHRCSEPDISGREKHYCPHDGSVRDGVRFTDNGFWDTYRTVYPFFSIVAKDDLRLMLKSYINEYKESGWLPRWLSIGEHGCMPSTLIDAVICDAAVKGLVERDDLETAFEGMLKHSADDAPQEYFGRNGASTYCAFGYVPLEVHKESVNLTLDAAYGDWCIAEIAKILGRDDVEETYRRRALNYKNLFDYETGFMRARGFSGMFKPDFVPEGWGGDYTEGSAWQNSFAVPHDIEGLAELYGGKDKLIEKIDALFACPPDYVVKGYECEIHEITEMAAVDFGQCAISNQPSFHIPYIYSALGEVDKTAYWVERLCKEAFSWKDDGFPGDEDNGAMALWYVFGVLGFYPFCPGKPEFIKGKKQVKKSVICGKEFDADRFDAVIPFSEFE